MKVNKELARILPFCILPITILSVSRYPGKITQFITIFGNTTLIWFVQFLILLIFLISRKYYFDKNYSKEIQILKWYLIYNMFSFARGIFIADTYWDWKALIANTLALLLPIVAYTGTNKQVFQSIFSYFIRYVLPLFLLFAFLIEKGAYGFYLVPVSFILLFLPVLSLRMKIIVLFLAAIVVIADLSARSNVIKFIVPIIFSLLYYTRNLLSTKIYEISRKLLFLLPVIFLSLALSNTFNVFRLSDYIEGDYAVEKSNKDGYVVESSLTADTRTGLYIDVLVTAKKYNSWWIGRSPARGNESKQFGEKDLSGRGERYGNEVAILNIFTWTGLVGVIFYFLIFYKASRLAINESRNIFAKILGLFIAFRWVYAWVEDINYFTLTTFVLWLMIGLCFSKSFREMSNLEIKVWIRGLFDKRYLNFVPKE
jgi:hypothetical protein